MNSPILEKQITLRDSLARERLAEGNCRLAVETAVIECGASINSFVNFVSFLPARAVGVAKAAYEELDACAEASYAESALRYELAYDPEPDMLEASHAAAYLLHL